MREKRIVEVISALKFIRHQKREERPLYVCVEWSVVCLFLLFSHLFTFIYSVRHKENSLDYISFPTTASTQRYICSTFTLQLFCFVGNLFTLPAISFSFYALPPPKVWEKSLPKKRIIIICGSALESNVLESWSNYRLWQMGPVASAPLLRSPRLPADKCTGVSACTCSLLLILLL